MEAVTIEVGSLFQCLTTLDEKTILSTGHGPYIGEPYKGALLGCGEWEEEKTTLDSHPISP